MWAGVGGLAGGAYGAFANDTSMLGGALGGAALFAGGYGAGVLGRRGYGVYRGLTGMGQGRRTAANLAFQAMAGDSATLIGNTGRRAYGRIQALGARGRGWIRGMAY